MSETINEFQAAGESPRAYFRTATGTRVHRPECPHLVGTDAHAATPSERLQHPVCDWSRAQEEGHGREHFATVEDAMRRVGVPVEAHDAVLDALRFVQHDEVFTVHSLTYGALGRDGRTVAGFGKTYYWVGGERINLPSYVDSSRSGHTAPQVYGDVCPTCHLALPLTGVCDDC
jgi:hypothetical protein